MLISLSQARKDKLSCPCVSKHVPLPTQYHRHHIVPKYLGGTDDATNLILLCPTSHYNVHSLLQAYARHKGVPPGKIRKHYSEFVQHLAAQAWDGKQLPRTASEDGMIVDPWWEEQVNDEDSHA